MTSTAATTFSVFTFKATRGAKVAHSALPWADAVREAGALYEASKVLNAAELLPTGVAVMVAEDTAAQAVVTAGGIHRDNKDLVLYQCGGY